jgi:hypothetical protein
MNDDQEHLDLLAIFHYVLAGMTALLACLPLIHLTIGIVFLVANFDGPNAPPRVIGLLMVIFAGFFILVGWTLALLILLAGRRLKRRAAWNFCLVVAAIECIFMPFGTVLGVFTIIVLSRKSVKELFGLKPAA